MEYPVKKKDVKIGSIYVAKVSGRLCRVRVDEDVETCTRTGQSQTQWKATNLETGKQILIRSASKLKLDLSKPYHRSFHMFRGKLVQVVRNPNWGK